MSKVTLRSRYINKSCFKTVRS